MEIPHGIFFRSQGIHMHSVPELFQQRLRQFLDGKSGRSGAIPVFRFAVEIEVDAKTVHNWLNGKSTPDLKDLEKIRSNYGDQVYEHLLGLKHLGKLPDETNENRSLVEWVEEIPYGLSKEQHTRASQGIALFRRLVTDRLPFYECLGLPEFANSSSAQLYQAFQFAVQCGALRILDVSRDARLEQDLMYLYAASPKGSLAAVNRFIVADVPNSQGIPILSELVAFLAAKSIFGERAKPPSTVGFGSGYTIARTAYYSHLYGSYDSKTEWIPLLSFNPELPVRFSANRIAAMLGHLHPDSHVLLQNHAHDIQLRSRANIPHETFNPTAIITTVNGFTSDVLAGQSDMERDNKYVDGYSSEWDYGPEWQYKRLQRTRQHDRVAGEFMGLLLDDDALPVLSDQELHMAQQNFARQIDHRHELYRLFRPNVWLVAAMQFKARAVRMAIRNGLAGNVVIDRSIAEWLLDNPAPLF
jgi:hypothetical protein